MNIVSIQKNLLNNLFLKLMAFCIGYCCWQMFNQTALVTTTLIAPIAFYNDELLTAETADHLQVTVQGPRKAMKQLMSLIAVHLDGHSFTQGMHQVPVTAQLLLLPEEIQLLHSMPDTIPVNILAINQ